MATKRDSKHNPVPIAFWAVAALVIACVAAAMFLVPSESQVMKRLTADGKIQRLREIVAEKTGSEPSDGELLEHAVDELGKNGWDETGTQAVEQLASNIDDLDESFAAVARIETKIPPAPAASIYSKMATRALAENQPKLAADAFQRIATLSSLDTELTTSTVKAFRACSEPGEAIAVLDQFELQNGGELPESLRLLRETLDLEVGNVDAAFASAREGYEMDKQRSPEKMREAIDKLITTGAHAGRTGELIPLCDEYLATTEAGKLSWMQILERRSADPDFDDQKFREVAHEAAKFCRWNNQPDTAFDLFRKLAALGSRDALQMCVDLHKPLLRESEMATLLDAFSTLR